MAPSSWSRWWRHLWLEAKDVDRLLGQGCLSRVESQVARSEKRHSGEIRVCVEASLPQDYLWRAASPRERAVDLFAQLRVWDTEANNGVLIYLLLADHAIELVADRGLSAKVDPQTWERLVAQMRSDFQRGQFEAGLSAAVVAVDTMLADHFPVDALTANPNELPNAPVVM
ncbi:MAG: hypothetical protein C4K60_12760 [Ideonella sp. MAG2]|nr:MAG: hypothetical protein C4K60_12760 [Ideonella sp. MAG2]